MTFRLTSIDVGIHHLALVSFRVPRSWRDDLLPSHLDEAKLVDMTRIAHEKVPEWACRLHHARETSDWMDHVVQENEEFFAPNVETILVERQPPEGIKAVEQYLFKRFRERVRLVSPNHVQCVLGYRAPNEYETRKSAVVRLCWDYLVVAFPELARKRPEDLRPEDRYHDLADAVAIARTHFLDLKREAEKEERTLLKLAERNSKKPFRAIPRPPERRFEDSPRGEKTSPYFEPTRWRPEKTPIGATIGTASADIPFRPEFSAVKRSPHLSKSKERTELSSPPSVDGTTPSTKSRLDAYRPRNRGNVLGTSF